MPDSSFVHLNVHSDFSMLQAASTIKGLAAKGKELGMSAMALTDYGNLCGAVEFYQTMKCAGIKPIIG
jgi:DNA polymerase III subunit alpha